MSAERPVVTPDDAERLDGVLEAWAEQRPGINVGELRGALLAALAEHRYQAYAEGMAMGRRQLAAAIKDTLADEGLL